LLPVAGTLLNVAIARLLILKENPMKREDAIQASEDAIKELANSLREGKSDMLVRYLEAASRFHRYSFSNCMLIYSQRPQSTQVAGFSKWKQFGRTVKKGEKGIGIIAPMIGKRKKEGGDEKSSALYGFRVVHVFDVAQTEGEDIPELDLAITGDVGDKLIRLEQFVQSQGIELEYVDEGLGSAQGVSKGGRIEVLASLPEAERFSILAHETAHELLHHGEDRSKTTKTVRELEAEAVAYVVCRSQHLECGNASSDYIQLYSGDEKLLLESLEKIRRVSAMIIDSLESSEVESEVQNAA